jgi:hypothetical protein
MLKDHFGLVLRVCNLQVIYHTVGYQYRLHANTHNKEWKLCLKGMVLLPTQCLNCLFKQINCRSNQQNQCKHHVIWLLIKAEVYANYATGIMQNTYILC